MAEQHNHDHGDHDHPHPAPDLPPMRSASRITNGNTPVARAPGPPTAATNGHAHPAGAHDDHDHGAGSHDHADDHGHDHGPGGHGHTHGAVDPSLFATQQGVRAVQISFVAMLVTSLIQLGVVLVTGSVALLADTIHNFGDALTAAPLWLAFAIGTRKPTKRFTYGYGRAEDLAGVIVVLIIFASAVAAAWESIDRLLHPFPVENWWVVIVAGVVGFAGNELVAMYRIRVGKQIGSAALIADGYHARADGFTSLGVVAGAVGVALGFPLADPIVGLLITVTILRIVWEAGGQVLGRLMDGVDTDVVDEIRAVLSQASGVRDVSDVRVRWSGHRMLAEVNLAVDPQLTVQQAHDITHEAEHQLLHNLQYLSAAMVHVDPVGASGELYHREGEHQHGEEPTHTHG